MSGPYILPAYSMDVAIVRTNKVPVSSVRGAGYPQAVFAMERTDGPRSRASWSSTAPRCGGAI